MSYGDKYKQYDLGEEERHTLSKESVQAPGKKQVKLPCLKREGGRFCRADNMNTDAEEWMGFNVSPGWLALGSLEREQQGMERSPVADTTVRN